MLKSLPILFLLVGATPAAAQSASPADAKAKTNPDRVVCERYEETGSRLATRKVCMTVREWDEQRRTQRNDVERAQQNVGIKSGG